MTGLTLVLGGIRSGKSAFAEQLAAATGPRVLYVATAEPSDAEMEQRIRRHRARRPASWGLLEAPHNLVDGVLSSSDRSSSDRSSSVGSSSNLWDAILVDSISGWLSNLLIEKLPAGGEPAAEHPSGDLTKSIEAEAGAAVASLLAWQRRTSTALILVSDEVGLGLVSAYPAGRLYQDLLGMTNQALAAAADCVYFIAAGIPLALKGALPPAPASPLGLGDDPDRR